MLAESLYAWQADLDTTLVVPVLALLYLFLAGRYGTTRDRAVSFTAALVLLAVAFWSPIHHLGLHFLLSAHLLQNVILAEWAPLLAVLGISPAMAAAASRLSAWRLLTHPAVALTIWLGSYYVWHIPAVYDAALRHQGSLIHLEHACYFGTGVLVWWPLVQDAPRRLPSGMRAGYAFAAFVLAAPLGLLLALLPRPIYSYYVAARPRVWGLTPLGDQELAGVTMAAEQALVLFVVFAYWFRRFLAEEGAT
ncbi:MAG TPA: cytochrome c oxidase assembly protein [Thermoleophilaceae bacterium]